jgi:hypothetical protein
MLSVLFLFFVVLGGTGTQGFTYASQGSTTELHPPPEPGILFIPLLFIFLHWNLSSSRTGRFAFISSAYNLVVAQKVFV